MAGDGFRLRESVTTFWPQLDAHYVAHKNKVTGVKGARSCRFLRKFQISTEHRVRLELRLQLAEAS